MLKDIDISITTDKDLIVASGTVDEQATLGELIDDVFSGVPLSNDDEMPDTPKSSSSNDTPIKDYDYVDTEKVRRYTCPYCKQTYINTHESMSHIAPVDMEQEEVLKCPHCGVPSVRVTLEFTEEIIEARPKRSYVPISREEKRFLCPHCQRAFNTTLETMWSLIPVMTEQGELRTCLYCETPSLKTTLESNADTMLREPPHIPIQADDNSFSNINIQPSCQPSSPDQVSTGTPSSQILEEIIHTPAYQNFPDQQPAFQPRSDEQPSSDSNSYQEQPAFHITFDQLSAIEDINDQYPAFQFPFDQQPAFQPSSDEQPISDSNSYQQPTIQSNLYQQQPAEQPAIYFNPDLQTALENTLDQQSAVQNITTQYPNFQHAFDQQLAFQPSLNRQSISQLSFNQQSTFSPTNHQQPASDSNSHQDQPAFQSDPFQQPVARPTLDQRQPAVHPNSNQQSTFGPNRDQQLASNPSSQTDLFEPIRCGYCGMVFYPLRSLISHRARSCECRVWYFCPEGSCEFHRGETKGFSQSANWLRHLLERHHYPYTSSLHQTYKGEVRDPRELTGWRRV